MRIAGAILLIGLWACQGPPSLPPLSDAAPASPTDLQGRDLARLDHAAADLNGMDAGASVGLTEVLMRDGTRRSGHLVAIYDQRRWWWDPADVLTYALFREDDFAAYPHDRSFSFLSSLEIKMISWSQPLATSPHFREFMRERGFLIYRSPLEGISQVITGHDSYHLDEDGYGDFAWDLVKTDLQGTTFADDGTHNEDHHVWDAPVFLPHRGYVLEVVRDAADNTPGTYPDGATNNMVGIHLEGSYYLYLLHFKQNSIPSPEDQSCEPHLPGVTCIEPGAILPSGTYIGRVGNSGVSLAPHLHLTFLWYDAEATPPRSWSIPAEFSGIHLSTTPEGPSTLEQYSVPRAGVWISSEAF